MAKTGMDRQREFRKRVNAAALAALEAELAAGRNAAAEAGARAGERLAQRDEIIASLEADLEQARQSPAAARCERCGTPLACPSCQGGGDWA